MNDHSFDVLTPQAARGISRRASLATLGVAGVAASLTVPVTTEAKKKKRKKKCKKDKDKNNEQCQEQVEQYIAIFNRACADPDAPEDCRERTGICCDSLGECQADEFLTCFLALLGIATEP